MIGTRKAPRPAGCRSPWEGIGLVLIAGTIIWAYAFLSSRSLLSLVHTEKKVSGEYYHYLVEGFLHGQLSMRVKPPPALVALPNPYDFEARLRIGELGLHDVSYYKGRYYLYFGPTPAIVLFLPFRVLTGVQFSTDFSSVLFCGGGYLFSLGLFLGFRRRYFPACGTGMVWLAAVMFGLGNFCLVMLMRNSVWEVPISCAYCFSILGYWLLFQAYEQTPRNGLRLVLASVAFGLAIGARPHFVFCGVVVGAFWLLGWRARAQAVGRWEWRPFLREAAALFLPLGAIIAALFLYNYLRFDNPFEFGQKYQLGGNGDLRHAKLMGLKFVPINFYYNFLAPAQIQRYFPFFEVIRSYPGIRPDDYLGFEDPYGLIPNMPIWWLALGAPALWAIFFRDRRSIASWMGVFAMGFLVLAGTILCFPGATNRYMVDYLPELQLLTGLGLLMVGSLAGGLSKLARLLLRAGAIAAVLYTSVFNVFVAFAHNGMFEAHRPDVYHTLQAWLDEPVLRWERWRKEPYGPIEMTVRFPRDKMGQVEPLLVTGVSYRSDYIHVDYASDGRSVRLGYSRTNHEQQISQPIPLDFNVPHRIGIASGALYPRRSHSFFNGWAPSDVESAHQMLRVTLDGVPYLDGKHEFFETTPGFVTIGRNEVSAYIGPRFTGEIMGVRRAALAPPLASFSGSGFVRTAFVLPLGAAGRREPLIATGVPGAGDLIFIAYGNSAQVRLGYHHAGSAPILSEPLPVVAGQIQLMEASLGSFYSAGPDADRRGLRRMLIVKFNGQVVWQEHRDFFPAGPQAPYFGVNRWRSDACEAAFSGQWIAVQPTPSSVPGPVASRFAFAPYWLETGAKPGDGPLRLHVYYPTGQAGKFEPLVVSGDSVSEADYLWIRYQEDNSDVMVGYEHTGAGGPHSRPFPQSFTRPHEIEIALPSLYPPQEDEFFADVPFAAMVAVKARAQVKVDGVIRLDSSVKSYESRPGDATPGENRLSETFGRKFTGRIVRIERAVHALPSGFASQSGPLEIALTWPDPLPAGRRELILATGNDGSKDGLYAQYEDDGHARLVMKRHDGKLISSPPLKIRGGGRLALRVSWGGFYPDAIRPKDTSVDEWRRFQRTYLVKVEGDVVLSGEAEFVYGDPQSVSLGSEIGGNSFTGSIRSVGRLPAQ